MGANIHNLNQSQNIEISERQNLSDELLIFWNDLKTRRKNITAASAYLAESTWGIKRLAWAKAEQMLEPKRQRKKSARQTVGGSLKTERDFLLSNLEFRINNQVLAGMF